MELGAESSVFFSREKKSAFRENFRVSVREDLDPSVKISQKLPVKPKFCAWKIHSNLIRETGKEYACKTKKSINIQLKVLVISIKQKMNEK